jgi:Icc-related predicted phosphoesterase
MQLYVISDIHIEFKDFVPTITAADIVVLAGDIGVGTSGVEWAAEHYPDVPVIYVPGNHEFYQHDIGIIERLKDAAPANVHVLSNDAFEHGGVRFLGTTLWTDFKFNGKGEAWFSRQTAKSLIEDFSSIRNGLRLFTPEDSVHLHRDSVHWLVTELEKKFSGPTIVVTHHLPSSLSVGKPYKGDPLNPAFASRLEGIIEKYEPDLWIHGHTHVPCDYEVFGTRVVCNPRGYPDERNQPAFRPDLVVSI